jgi:hypothetical protein
MPSRTRKVSQANKRVSECLSESGAKNRLREPIPSPSDPLTRKRSVPTLFWACARPRTKHLGSGQVWGRICNEYGPPDAAFGKTDGIPEGIVYYDFSNGYDWKDLPLPDNAHQFGFWDPLYEKMYRPEAMEIWRVCRRLAVLHPLIYPTSWFAGGRREVMVAVTFGPFKMIRCLQIFTK